MRRNSMIRWFGGGLLLAAAAVALGTAFPQRERQAPLQQASPAPGRTAQPAGGPSTPEAVATDAALQDAALSAALNRVRYSAASVFHDVQAFRFGPDDEAAVCGRVQPNGGADPQIGFVVRVLLPSPTQQEGRWRPKRERILTVLETGPGLPEFSSGSAQRRYCHNGVQPDARPVSFSPDNAASASGASAAVAPSAPVREGGGGRPLASATVRSPANLRDGPSGSAPILRTAGRGETFWIHGRAPGGWLNVGDAERSVGWIHSSLLDMNPP